MAQWDPDLREKPGTTRVKIRYVRGTGHFRSRIRQFIESQDDGGFYVGWFVGMNDTEYVDCYAFTVSALAMLVRLHYGGFITAESPDPYDTGFGYWFATAPA
jgi:hypothetical protein